MAELNERSMQRVKGVNADLVQVLIEGARTCPLNFQVTQGLRSKTEQRRLVAEGKSFTLNSRHLTGHAIDVVVIIGGRADWTLSNYRLVSLHILAAARKLGIAVEWGGDWPRLRDGPHFQLSRKAYPAGRSIPHVASSRDLRMGSKGDAVEQLQNKVGIKVDGHFGPDTEKAVMKWQEERGLDPDGIVGKLTRRVMRL